MARRRHGKGWNPGGRKGKLHRALGISTKRKIPAGRLRQATHSKNPSVRRMAIRAETMKKWRHVGRKPRRSSRR